MQHFCKLPPKIFMRYTMNWAKKKKKNHLRTEFYIRCVKWSEHLVDSPSFRSYIINTCKFFFYFFVKFSEPLLYLPCNVISVFQLSIHNGQEFAIFAMDDQVDYFLTSLNYRFLIYPGLLTFCNIFPPDPRTSISLFHSENSFFFNFYKKNFFL